MGKRSKLYLYAAERSLLTGDGLSVLDEESKEGLDPFYDFGGDHPSLLDSPEDFCLSLLFMAHAVESGDA